MVLVSWRLPLQLQVKPNNAAGLSSIRKRTRNFSRPIRAGEQEKRTKKKEQPPLGQIQIQLQES